MKRAYDDDQRDQAECEQPPQARHKATQLACESAVLSSLSQVPDYTFDDVRLSALADLRILDTAPEEGFDNIVELATHLCACPVALVSLVDRDRQWFKARVNFPLCETDLNSSVCAHALASPDVLIIPDLTADPRTALNPLVTGDPFIRFYAGAPLRTKEGRVLGSLCVIDNKPRLEGLTQVQVQGLKSLAGQVMTQIELRCALMEQEKALRQTDVLIRTQKAISLARGDLDAVLGALLMGAMEAMPKADGGVIEMREGEEIVYHCTQGTVESHLGLRQPLQGSLAGSCLLTGKAIVCQDVRLDKRVKADVIEMLCLRSFIAIPVFRNAEAVGVLKLQSSRPGTFSDDDVKVATIFAGAVPAGLAEAAFRNQSEILQTVTAYVAQAVFLMDVDGCVTFVNPEAERLFGWLAAELVGRVLHDTLHHSHADGTHYSASACVLVRSLHDGQRVCDHEDVFFRKDGTPINVVITSAPVTVDGKIVSAVLTVSDITTRKKVEAQQRLLNEELSHRMKNSMAMVQAIAVQTLRNVAEKGAIAAFTGRVHALAAAHDVLLQESWQAAEIGVVVAAALETFSQPERFHAYGPDLRLGSRATLSLSLLLHELATNASKYGSLSTEGGKVGLSWRLEQAELVINWQETGGPPAVAPTRKGFGSRLIQLGLIGTGGVTLTYEETGFSAELRALLADAQVA